MAYFESATLQAPQSPQNVASTPVQNTEQFEGTQTIELLAMILIELRILNQQIYELPNALATGAPPIDTPENYRKDPSFYTATGYNI
jgi:hypothetical protein